MNLADPGDIQVRITLLIPIITCLLSLYGVHKTNGNMMAGFNNMEPEKRKNS